MYDVERESQTWALCKNEGRILEMKMLRWIVGISLKTRRCYEDVRVEGVGTET